MFKGSSAADSDQVSRGRLSYRLRRGGELFVVFLHGLGCAKESFVEAFDGGWFGPAVSLLAVDLPGHGDSVRHTDFSYDLDIQAIEVQQLLDMLGIRRAVIVAHSMGNICGLKIADEIAELAGYYCLEGNLISSDCGLSDRVIKYDEPTFVSKFYPIARQNFHCPGCDGRNADPVAIYRSARSLVKHCIDDLPLQAFLGINAPKSYVYGGLNVKNPVLERLAGVNLIEVPGAGHFMMNDSPSFLWREIARRIEST